MSFCLDVPIDYGAPLQVEGRCSAKQALWSPGRPTPPNQRARFNPAGKRKVPLKLFFQRHTTNSLRDRLSDGQIKEKKKKTRENNPIDVVKGSKCFCMRRKKKGFIR